MEGKRSGSKKHSKKEAVVVDNNDAKNRAQIKTDGIVNVSDTRLIIGAYIRAPC